MTTLEQPKGGLLGEGPLKGITVLDLSRVLAGPYCTLLLADLGARVIKVENPEGGGDDARDFGPFIAEKSAYFMSLNRGKESIALNLKRQEDRETFLKLLAKADVLVENFRGGAMEKLGLGYEQLRQHFPKLIYAAVTGFGHSGPMRHHAAYDMVVQAMGGMMSLTGQPGSEPTRVGTSIGDIAAGLFAAVGINAALFQRMITGRGTKIDIGMLDCQVAILENAIARFVATGEVPGPLGSRHPSIAPFEAFATSDSWIVIAAGNDALFGALARALGHAQWIDDPRFRENAARCKNVEALSQEIGNVLKTRGARYWLDLMETAGVPAGPINNVAQVLEDAQILARNMVVTAHDPAAGPVKMAGNPIKFSGVEDPSTRPPAPNLDGDREKILKLLD
jgi:CoA:oxalate CoA-transferase